MSKQVQDAYIVAATRTPIGKSGRGYFRNTRPDDLLVAAILSALKQVPTLDPKAIEDAIIGCSFPEAEQGMNMARIAVLLCGLPKPVGGVTVNRFCASGLTAVQMAADRIRVGEADVMIAGGAEIDEPGADGRQQALVQPRDLRPRRERRHRLRHGPHRREGGGAVEGEPRGAGRVRAGVAPARAEGAGGRRVHGRDDADRRGRALPEPRDRRDDDEHPHRRPRRRPAPGHLARRPRQAEAGVRRQGQRHRRQQLADQRRRRRADPRQREGGQAVRPEAAGALRQLRGTRRAAGDHGHRPDRGDSRGAASTPA